MMNVIPLDAIPPGLSICCSLKLKNYVSKAPSAYIIFCLIYLAYLLTTKLAAFNLQILSESLATCFSQLSG